MDFGALCSNSSCANFGFWILDFGFWILDFGFQILDFGLGAFSGTFFGCYIIELVLCTPTRVGGFLRTGYYSLLQSSSPYYKVLLRAAKHYTILQITLPYYKVQLHASKYCNVLQCITRYCKLLQCITK